MLEVVESAGPREPGRGFFTRSRRLLSIPGVRLAYWVHFTTPFSANIIVLLWGTPFLTGGVGLPPSTAAFLVSLMVVASMLGGLVLGPMSSRFVERRVRMAIWISVTIALAWSAVLLWPGPPPVWLLGALMCIIAVGGPTSMIAFEVARSHTPRSFAGFGTGLVNTGGFTSSLLVIFLIGLALDLQGAGSPALYTLEAFRWALAVQLPFLLLGITMLIIEERRTGDWMRRHGRRLR